MGNPRRFARLLIKRKKGAKLKKPIKKAKKPFPLMNLNNDILCLIIYELERAFVYWKRMNSLPSRRFGVEYVKNLSLVNKRMRELSIPTLFKYTKIYDDFAHMDDPVFPSLFESLNSLAKQPLILNAIQHFIVETTALETTYHYDTPNALWKCLPLMTNLKEISIRLRGSAKLLPLLESHLTHNRELPTLHTVRSISLYTAPMREISKFVKLTPNVENAAVEIPCCIRHSAQIRALSKLPHLKYLMLCRVVPRPRDGAAPFGWGVDDIRAIAESVPGIKYLALVGQLDDHHDFEARLSDYIEPFAKFTKLERLDMTDEFVIDSEFAEEVLQDMRDDDEDFISDSEDGLDLTGVAESLAEDHYLNEERPEIARKFFNTCPTLRQLYLTRCEMGELFERGDDLEAKKTQTVVGTRMHDFAFGYPRVLKANATPQAAPLE